MTRAMPLISSIERPPVDHREELQEFYTTRSSRIVDSAIAVTARAALDESGHVFHVPVGRRELSRSADAGPTGNHATESAHRVTGR